jgi:hypothetical protein
MAPVGPAIPPPERGIQAVGPEHPRNLSKTIQTKGGYHLSTRGDCSDPPTSVAFGDGFGAS